MFYDPPINKCKIALILNMRWRFDTPFWLRQFCQSRTFWYMLSIVKFDAPFIFLRGVQNIPHLHSLTSNIPNAKHIFSKYSLYDNLIILKVYKLQIIPSNAKYPMFNFTTMRFIICCIRIIRRYHFAKFIMTYANCICQV